MMESYRFPPRVGSSTVALPSVEMEVESSTMALSPLSQFFSTLHHDSDSTQTRSTQSIRHLESDAALSLSPTMRKNSLGLDMNDDQFDERQFHYPTPSSSASSPPLVPFTFRRRQGATTHSGSSSAPAQCPPSPPLVALSLPPFYSSPASSSSSSAAPPAPRPERSDSHPLNPKLRLEMTPLPPFTLPLADVEMSPPMPWTNLATDESSYSCPSPLPKQGRKNSLVPLPVTPPTPPLTPSEELPPFDFEQHEEPTRGRSTKITPLAKRRRFA